MKFDPELHVEGELCDIVKEWYETRDTPDDQGVYHVAVYRYRCGCEQQLEIPVGMPHEPEDTSRVCWDCEVCGYCGHQRRDCTCDPFLDDGP